MTTAPTANTLPTPAPVSRTWPLRDTATMLRRSLRHLIRYPSMTLMLVGLPVVFLLLFVYVLGGTMGGGLIDASGGRAAYLDYIVPGILVMTVAGAVQGTAISVAMDITSGIVARFRTMAVAPTAVLTGRVLGGLIQTMVSLVLVLGIAMLMGFRPTATPFEWLALTGLMALVTLALIWLAVALGVKAKSVETASNTPMILLLLPFLSSGFVPTETLPGVLRAFAENQPFTPIIETIRGLLTGTPIGNDGLWAVGWCVLIAGGSYLWARHLFAKRASR